MSRRRRAENEDGQTDVRRAQLLGFVDAGHREVARTALFQPFGHRHRAVAVGVRLDDAEKTAARREF